MNYPPAFERIRTRLSSLDNWDERFRTVMELGQELPDLTEAERTASNRIAGCVSQVWLVCTVEDGVLAVRGESDALIVRGLVAILVALFSGRPVDAVARTDVLAEFDALGLRDHLTAQRANGTVAMIRHIRAIAEQAVSQTHGPGE